MTTKVIAVYARQSKDDNGDSESVDTQIKRGRAYAASHWPGAPVEVYEDRDTSAGNPDAKPPGRERLLKDVRRGRIAQVVVRKQNRLTRLGPLDWEEFVRACGIGGIHEIHGYQDGVTPIKGSKLIGRIKAAMDADMRESMIAEINDQLDENAGRGYPPPVTPFGYYRWTEIDGQPVHVTNDKGEPTFEIIDSQADAIRFAAEKVMAGWSLTRVAEELRGRGVTGRSGGTITATTVRTWLRSPTIAGKRVHRGEIIRDGNWPPILAWDTFETVNARLGTEREVTAADGTRTKVTAGQLRGRTGFGRRYVLSGLAVCGVCGAPTIGAVTKLGKRGKPKPRLKCRKGHASVSMDAAEQYVLDQLWAELDRPEFLDQLGFDAAADRREEILAELDKAERRRRELGAMWATGGLATADWEAARDALDDLESALRDELAGLPAPTTVIDIAGAREGWHGMTLDERREFLRLFIDKVIVRAAANGTRLPIAERLGIEWRTT